MLITKEFIFIHLPKTGGQFLKGFCQKNLPKDWILKHEVGKHQGLGAIPNEYRNLPKFSLIRNPWDWYVSWYHYEQRVQSNNSTWLLVSNQGKNDFKTTIYQLCSGHHAVERVSNKMKHLDVDLLTLHHWGKCGNSPTTNNITIGCLEKMPDCFINFLTDHNLEIPANFIQRIKKSTPTNTSKRGHYTQYYDQELKELVQHKARYLIEAYGYSFSDDRDESLTSE